MWNSLLDSLYCCFEEQLAQVFEYRSLIGGHLSRQLGSRALIGWFQLRLPAVAASLFWGEAVVVGWGRGTVVRGVALK